MSGNKFKGIDAFPVTPFSESELFEFLQQGNLDESKEVFDCQLPLLEFICSRSLPATVKAGLELLGIEVRAWRSPILPLPTEEREELLHFLDRLGVIESV